MTLPFHITPRATTKHKSTQQHPPSLFVLPLVSNFGARPAIPSGPGKAARVPTVKHVVTCAATFRGSLCADAPFLLECLPREAPVKRQEHSSQQRKELNTMTSGLAFINQYLANASHMRTYFVSLC